MPSESGRPASNSSRTNSGGSGSGGGSGGGAALPHQSRHAVVVHEDAPRALVPGRPEAAVQPRQEVEQEVGREVPAQPPGGGRLRRALGRPVRVGLLRAALAGGKTIVGRKKQTKK